MSELTFAYPPSKTTRGSDRAMARTVDIGAVSVWRAKGPTPRQITTCRFPPKRPNVRTPSPLGEHYRIALHPCRFASMDALFELTARISILDVCSMSGPATLLPDHFHGDRT